MANCFSTPAALSPAVMLWDEEKRHSDSVCALDMGTILLFEISSNLYSRYAEPAVGRLYCFFV